VSGLSYVESFEHGYTRRRVGDKWVYRTLRGMIVTAQHIVDHLNAIGLPPAYTDVWFCASANGHIQAYGYDAKGRRQYGAVSPMRNGLRLTDSPQRVASLRQQGSATRPRRPSGEL
jgi:DNA topoisomerase IB